MSTALEPRVSELEKSLKELAYAQLRAERSLEEAQRRSAAGRFPFAVARRPPAASPPPASGWACPQMKRS